MDLFDCAEKNSPSLIFIDQFETLSSSQAPRQIHRLLETQMSRLTKGKTEGVVLIASTRKPWDIDKFLLSLFQERLHIGMPSEVARNRIFQTNIEQIHESGVPCSVSRSATPTDIEMLVRSSDGLSVKGIVDCVEAALRLPLRKVQHATHFKPVRVFVGLELILDANQCRFGLMV